MDGRYVDGMDQNTLTRELVRLRKEAGLTQEELADLLTKSRIEAARRAGATEQPLPVSQSYVAKIETATSRADVDQIEEWARACGVEFRVSFDRPGIAEDPDVDRIRALAPYAPPDLRIAILNLLENVAALHLRRAVR